MPPELPLFIATKEKTKPQYDDVLQASQSTLNRLYAPMGGFVVANTPNDPAVLHTSGALTCTVMVVHMKRGVGAIGHFYHLYTAPLPGSFL